MKISNTLSNLKEMRNNMSRWSLYSPKVKDELDRQNNMLDNLTDKLSNQNVVLKKTNKRMKNI